MDLQNNNDFWTSSFPTEIPFTASERMQNVWKMFFTGVKSLHKFSIILNEPCFDIHGLQKHLTNAQTQISLSEKEIVSAHNDIKTKIDYNLKQRQKYEKDISGLKCQKGALSDTIRIKKYDIEEAKHQVSAAELEVKTHEKKEKEAKIKAGVVTGVSVVLGIVGGVAAAGITIVSGGLALPVVATGASALTAGAGSFSSTLFICKYADAVNDLRKKKYTLEERKTELQMLQIEQHTVECRDILSAFELEGLKNEHTDLIDECKVITWLQESIIICHDFINIALGRVNILHEALDEMKNCEMYRENLKCLLNKVAEHLLTVDSIESLSQYVQNVPPTIRMIKSIHSECERMISDSEDTESYIL